MGTLRSFDVLEEVCTDRGLLLSDIRPELRLAVSVPNSLRKSNLHDGLRRDAWYYSNLLSGAVRAQKRGTRVQPQPHEDLAQFE